MNERKIVVDPQCGIPRLPSDIKGITVPKTRSLLSLPLWPEQFKAKQGPTGSRLVTQPGDDCVPSNQEMCQAKATWSIRVIQSLCATILREHEPL